MALGLAVASRVSAAVDDTSARITRQWHDPVPTALDLDLQEHKAGRNRAQIAGTVFFLIDTLVMADGFGRPVATGSRVLVIFIWLISLAVVALRWLRASPASSSSSSSSLGSSGLWQSATRHRDA